MALAAMHYNENSTRTQATTAEGEEQYSIHFPKSREGKATVRVLKTAPTYSKHIWEIIKCNKMQIKPV